MAEQRQRRNNNQGSNRGSNSSPPAMPGLPPQNTEAEASLLGAILIDSDAIVKIADIVQADDFYEERHARIYEAAVTLYERHNPIDVLTLSDHLKNAGNLEIAGGAGYLTELTNFVPTAAHAEQYAQIVAGKATRRKLIKASQDITAYSYDETKTLQELVESAETRLFEVSQKQIKQDITSIENILSASFDRLDELHKDKGKLRGVPTGFKDLDNVLAGFQPSDLIILAARPSMGKTALSLNLAHNVAVKAKLPVIFFSLEMSKEQLVDRLLSAEAGVNAWNLRTGNLTDSDFEKIGQAMGTLSEAQIYIDDTPGITISDMRTKARREAHQHPLGLIIVDYLQLMSGGARFGGDSNRVQEISEISRGLKGVARELHVPIIALSQLSRSVESRSPQIPQLSDLRESGCLTGDTLVFQPETGGHIPIRELVGKDITGVSSLNMQSWRLTTTNTSHAFSTGIKPVYRLTTQTGRTIRATANHKFLTINGWLRLDELTVNNHLAVPRILPSGAEVTHAVPAMATAGVTTRQLHAGINTAYSGTTLYKSNLSRARAQLVAEVVRSQELALLATSDIYWDKIVSIEADGIEDVYDLTVPGHHNFVAGDIVVHNSIEQDADVVAFIYREDYYNPETENKNITKILIKKHRNGPTEDVDLYFDREKQRFRSLDTKHSPFDS